MLEFEAQKAKDKTGYLFKSKFVLSRRFPSDPSRKRQTLEQIGRDIRVSKERVRQIQNGALLKLRSAMEADPVLR